MLVDAQIPWMLMRSTLSRLAQENGHRGPRGGCFKVRVVHIFNEIAMHAKALASNRMAKANRGSHGPRVRFDIQARGKSKEHEVKIHLKIQRNQKCEPRCRRLAQGQNIRKLVSQVLKTRNQRQVQKLSNRAHVMYH